MQISNTKKLITNIFLMFIVYLFPKIFGFLLIPIYTNYLTPEEYGISDLVICVSAVLMSFISLATPSALMRFTIENKNDIRPFQIAFKTSFCGVSCVIPFVFISYYFYDIPYYFLIYIVVIAFFSVLSDIYMSYTRAIEKLKVVTICSVLCSFIGLSCNILFIVVFKWGVFGFLSSNVIGYIFISIFLMIYHKEHHLYKNILNKQDKVLRAKILSFSVPLIFSSLCWMIISSSDKYFVASFCGIAATGLYAVAYKIPIILQSLSDVFGQAWTFTVYDNYKTTEGKKYISKVLNVYFFTLSFISSCLITSDIYISKFLFSKEFFVAWKYVPFLVLSVLFLNLSNIMSVFFSVYNKTKLSLYISIITACSNLLLNYILIFVCGDAIGAAIATLIAFLIKFMLSSCYGLRYSEIKLKLKKHFCVYIILIVQSILIITTQNFLISIFFTFAILLLNIDEILIIKDKIFQSIKNKLKKKLI